MSNNYRVYRLDRANHVVEFEWVAAASDAEAIAAARAMKSAGKREIWLGERLVGTVHVAAAEQPSGAFWL
jgi:hypothetical protein